MENNEQVEKKFTDNEPEDITILDMDENARAVFYAKIQKVMNAKKSVSPQE